MYWTCWSSHWYAEPKSSTHTVWGPLILLHCNAAALYLPCIDSNVVVMCNHLLNWSFIHIYNLRWFSYSFKLCIICPFFLLLFWSVPCLYSGGDTQTLYIGGVPLSQGIFFSSFLDQVQTSISCIYLRWLGYLVQPKFLNNPCVKGLEMLWWCGPLIVLIYISSFRDATMLGQMLGKDKV